MTLYAPHHKKEDGFTLVEMAIVLTILSILVAGGLSISNTQMEVARIKSTKAKLERIEEALRLHKEMFADLPCPADGSLAETDGAFGEEDCGSGNFEANSGGESNRTWMGVVPTRKLNLPDEFMLDGWGRRISYAVDKEYADGVWHDDITAPASRGQGSIEIQDIDGDERTSQGTVEGVDVMAIYVLISHGRNGIGAWSQDGGSRIDFGSPSNMEIENAHVGGSAFDNEFIDDHIRGKKTDANYFDDYVVWKIKGQLQTYE